MLPGANDPKDRDGDRDNDPANQEFAERTPSGRSHGWPSRRGLSQASRGIAAFRSGLSAARFHGLTAGANPTHTELMDATFEFKRMRGRLVSSSPRLRCVCPVSAKAPQRSKGCERRSMAGQAGCRLIAAWRTDSERSQPLPRFRRFGPSGRCPTDRTQRCAANQGPGRWRGPGPARCGAGSYSRARFYSKAPRPETIVGRIAGILGRMGAWLGQNAEIQSVAADVRACCPRPKSDSSTARSAGVLTRSGNDDRREPNWPEYACVFFASGVAVGAAAGEDARAPSCRAAGRGHLGNTP